MIRTLSLAKDLPRSLSSKTHWIKRPIPRRMRGTRSWRTNKSKMRPLTRSLRRLKLPPSSIIPPRRSIRCTLTFRIPISHPCWSSSHLCQLITPRQKPPIWERSRIKGFQTEKWTSPATKFRQFKPIWGKKSGKINKMTGFQRKTWCNLWTRRGDRALTR